MLSVRGVYPHGKRFRVRKYGVHLGVYNTIEEANQVAKDAEEFHRTTS